MQRFYKLAIIVITLLLVFSLAGCGTSSKSVQGQSEPKSEKNEEQADNNDQTENEPVASGEEIENSVEHAASHESQEEASAASDKKQSEAVKKETETKDISNKNQAPSTPQKKPSSSSVKPAPPAKEKKSEPVQTVTISIIGPKEFGTILSSTKVELKEGDRVLDILKKAAKPKGIEVETSTYYGATYVEGIDGIYEGDYGGQSGWTYKLNGTLTPKSAGNIDVKDGDKIVWEYVGD